MRKKREKEKENERKRAKKGRKISREQRRLEKCEEKKSPSDIESLFYFDPGKRTLTKEREARERGKNTRGEVR